MSGGKKTTDTSQNSTTTNTIDPWSKQLLTDNLTSAQGNAAKIDNPYTGPLTAGFNPTQTSAQGVLSGIATDPSYQAGNTAAAGAINGVLGASNGLNTTITPQTLADTDLSKYENPFTSDVINRTISDNERARQIQRVQDQQSATVNNAFGGSRSGVADSLTNEAYDRNSLDKIAGLNSDNFTQARSAATTDIGNNLNAQQASINAALAKYGVQLNAAGQLVQTTNNGLQTAVTQGGILSAVGDAQQQQQQAENDAKYQEFLRQQQIPIQQQQLLNSALGLVPVQQTVASSGTGQNVEKTSGGLGGILGGILGLGQAAGDLGWAPFA